AWLIFDGPTHQNGRPQLIFGARGIQTLELTCYGATRALHSGHYGNWAPNPVMLLAHLLTSMRDHEGRIRIEGFADEVRPLTTAERRMLTSMPEIDSALRQELSLAWSEGSGRIHERIMVPAMNLRGVSAGHVGSGTPNAIPTEAKASIDFRLVPDQKPETIRLKVEQHMRKHGFFV